MLGFPQFCWLFAIGITIHNIEEAIWLPNWSHHVGKWLRPIGAAEFRFAVTVLTLLAYAGAYLVSILPQGSGAHYFMGGYALAMLLNAGIPHLATTIVTRHYAPGTATALLFNVPLAVLLLRHGLEWGAIQMTTFIWAGPLVVLGIAAAIPILFTLGVKINQ